MGIGIADEFRSLLVLVDVPVVMQILLGQFDFEVRE